MAGHDYAKETGGWVESYEIKYREEIVDGLENAPEAFVGLLKGEKFGECVIRAGEQSKENTWKSSSY